MNIKMNGTRLRSITAPCRKIRDAVLILYEPTNIDYCILLKSIGRLGESVNNGAIE